MNAHELLLLPQARIRLPAANALPAFGRRGAGAVVHIANSSGDTVDRLHRQLDAARKSVSDLVAENEALKREVERLKLELKLERQNKFATNRQRQSAADRGQDFGKPFRGSAAQAGRSGGPSRLVPPHAD